MTRIVISLVIWTIVIISTLSTGLF